MASHVALLRGINVGGRNKVPMADLREVVTSLGHTGVSTYIQSGNVLFSTADTQTREAGRGARVGHRGQVRDLVVGGGPEPGRARAGAGGQSVSGRAEPQDGARGVPERRVARGPARADLGGRERRRGQGQPGHRAIGWPGGSLFLHTPDGFGTSELAQNVFKIIAPPKKSQARPGRHGQELGHRDQTPVAVRGEEVRLGSGANHSWWRPEGVLPCPNEQPGPPTGGSPSPTCRPRPTAASAGRCSPATTP